MSCKRCKCKVCSCIVNEQVKIAVNKIIQNPDEKGIINIKVPTKTSELINDSGFGQGSEGSSKIENIGVNNTLVPIVNKVAQIYIPTKVSDLENDSDYTTNARLAAHTSNKTNPHNVTKEQIGLGNVDNTSDLNKPISTATQTELNKKINKPTISNTPDYVLLADGSTAPKSDFGKVNSVNGINPDNNKNIKVGINEILKEYQPNIVADKNKKVLLFDEDGKTYYFNLGNIITNTSVDESLFVNVDNLLGVNTTSAITEKVINNFENITYPIDISLDYNYTEISDIFINSCLKLPRDYYYIVSNNRIKIKDFSDLINTENWEKLFIEITGTKNINYEQ